MTVPRLMDLVKEKCTEVYSEARYYAWCKYWHYLRKSSGYQGEEASART